MIRMAVGMFMAVAPLPAMAQSASLKELERQVGLVSKPALVAQYGPTALQGGELRLPEGKGPFPVAVVMHGGCWMNFVDRTSAAPLADALAKRGIATWNVGYRRIGDEGGGWPGTFEDVAAATDHLRVLAKSQPLDLKRVTLIGHSAGAHLVLWAAARPKLGHAVAGKDPLKVASVFAIDGPGALAPFIGADAQVCGQPVIARLMGGTPAEKPGEYRAASPADHLPLGLRTYLVVADLAPFMQPYADAARQAGEKIELLTPPGADHFDIITPGAPEGEQVIQFIVDKAFKAR